MPIVPRFGGAMVRKWVTCRDGFVMSVQASAGHQCIPRDDSGPYTAVEVGCPSQHEAALEEYADPNEFVGDDEDRPTDTVFGRVPIGVVDAILESHGGAVSGKWW